MNAKRLTKRTTRAYSVGMLGFLFVAAWAASDSIFMALLAVGLFVGILLMTVIDNLAVQKQQFIKNAESVVDSDGRRNDSTNIQEPR